MTSSGLSAYSQGVARKFLEIGYLAPRRSEQADRRLNIYVVSTSPEATGAALAEAGKFAESLGAQLTLLVTQIVPYPLPLDNPPVSAEFNERRFRALAVQNPIETRVRVFLCRDKFTTLTSLLYPSSVVVIGGRRRRRWPTRDERLAGKLRHAGHDVIFVQPE